MYLEINGSAIDEPLSDELIEKSVYSLGGEGDSFLILSTDEMTYMQASGDPGRGFALEYQDGSLEEHYYCADPYISAGKVTDAFRSYLAQDDKWRSRYEWQKGYQAANTSHGVARYIILSVIVVALAFLVWQFIDSS